MNGYAAYLIWVLLALVQSVRAKRILNRLRSALRSGFAVRALQRNPHVVLLNLDWYHAKLRPLMADWLYMWLEAQHLAGMSEAAVKAFLLRGPVTQQQQQQQLEAGQQTVAEQFESNLSPYHRKMLNLGRDWLQSYLPHVLQKIDRVSFGIMNAGDYERAVKADPRMPRTRAKLAIPFVGKDVPSRSSEFAHPDVIIGLTVLAYRYEGLRWTDFEDVMAHLRSTLTKELGPWSRRKSNLRYARWVHEAGGVVFGEDSLEDSLQGEGGGGGAAVGAEPNSEEDQDHEGDAEGSSPIDTETDQSNNAADAAGSGGNGTFEGLRGGSGYDADNEKVVVSLRLLKRSNEEQMRKLFNLLRTLPDVIHYYLENFIFPVYTDSKITKLSAAGQELGGEMLFRKRIGFSGTPSDLLPTELGQCGYERCSDGQMIHVLTSPSVCSYEVVAEGWGPLSLLQRIATSTAPRFHALIDTGALITGKLYTARSRQQINTNSICAPTYLKIVNIFEKVNKSITACSKTHRLA